MFSNINISFISTLIFFNTHFNFLMCNETINNRMMNSFWWGHNRQNVKGINWMSWERLSINKMNGGLGFKNLRAFNNAMLGKRAWKFMTDPNIIVTRLFKAKYFSKCDFLDSRCGHNPSYVWRSIWGARNVVKAGYKWSIGSGLNIPFWD